MSWPQQPSTIISRDPERSLATLVSGLSNEQAEALIEAVNVRLRVHGFTLHPALEHCKVAVVVALDREEFRRRIDDPEVNWAETSVWPLHLMYPAASEGAEPWSDYQPGERETIRLSIRLAVDAESLAANIVEGLREKHLGQPCPFRMRRILEGRALYNLMMPFSHNQWRDLTNQVLAPQRILTAIYGSSKLTDHWAEGTKIEKEGTVAVKPGMLRAFQDEVVAKIGARCGELGEELLNAWRRLDKAEWTTDEIPAIEHLMFLMTESRVLAGERTASQDVSPAAPDLVEPVGSSEAATELYRILVVDDHAGSWRPVFDRLASDLCEKVAAPVRVDFSVDGRSVKTRLGNVVPFDDVAADYDVVLLDVFLGGTHGLGVLTQLRRFFLTIPVLIWTTSRDIDIPASASLANGFLFKKSTSYAQLVDTLYWWLEGGRAQRAVSIPSRFFDRVISDSRRRTAAENLGNWALQLLDFFPALDPLYFRVFTDHGGRHVVGLLRYMEAIARSLVLGRHVFSDDAEAQRTELLTLYLAVLCHEFGMFPVFDEDRAFTGLKASQLVAVRTLHAVRGMMFLAKPDAWPAEVSHTLQELLDDEFIRVALPLLVGYHSRFLGSLKTGDFLKGDQVKQSFASKEKVISQAGGIKGGECAEVESVFTELAGRCDRLDSASRERIRKLCAVMRFVDALDVDRSRLPPKFMRLHPRSIERADQHVDYVKRDVVEKLDIREGSVNLTIAAHKEDLDLFTNDGEPGKWIVKEPWHPENREKALRNREGLEDWQKIVAEAFKQRNWEQLGEWGLTEQNRLAADGPRRWGALAGLSVAYELLDEYQAILDAGLEGQIRLGDITWRGARDVHSLGDWMKGYFQP